MDKWNIFHGEEPWDNVPAVSFDLKPTATFDESDWSHSQWCKDELKTLLCSVLGEGEAHVFQNEIFGIHLHCEVRQEEQRSVWQCLEDNSSNVSGYSYKLPY